MPASKSLQGSTGEQSIAWQGLRAGIIRMTTREWHTRGLTSLFTTAGFLVMSLTGIAAYIVPQGRIAYWTDWHFLGLSKTRWGDIHIISSLLLIVAGSFHIWFNWKPLMKYLLDKGRRTLRLKREISLDLNGWVKAAWVRSPDYEPPFGHAEEVSLKTLCSKQYIDLDAALAALEEAGYGTVDPAAKFIDTARALGTTPRALYSDIKDLERPPVETKGEAYTAAAVEEQFAGSGIGNKTIAEIAAQTGRSAGSIRERLQSAGVTMADDDSAKQAADANGLSAPMELLKTMLVDGYRPGSGEE